MKILDYTIMGLIIIAMSNISCATKSQTVRITEFDDGLKIEQEQPGIVEAERNKDGWKVKLDNKKEPWKLLDLSGLSLKNEN